MSPYIVRFIGLSFSCYRSYWALNPVILIAVIKNLLFLNCSACQIWFSFCSFHNLKVSFPFSYNETCKVDYCMTLGSHNDISHRIRPSIDAFVFTESTHNITMFAPNLDTAWMSLKLVSAIQICCCRDFGLVCLVGCISLVNRTQCNSVILTSCLSGHIVTWCLNLAGFFAAQQ